jgi:uncharacterized FlaG/YvyC family protein
MRTKKHYENLLNENPNTAVGFSLAESDGTEMTAVTEPTTELIVRKIPESVRRELKARAAREGKTMQGVILELITEYTKEQKG